MKVNNKLDMLMFNMKRLPVVSSTRNLIQRKMIAPYTATSKEQLSLAKGQMVIVRKKTETGWW